MFKANTEEEIFQTTVDNALSHKECALRHNLLVDQIKKREE